MLPFCQLNNQSINLLETLNVNIILLNDMHNYILITRQTLCFYAIIFSTPIISAHPLFYPCIYVMISQCDYDVSKMSASIQSSYRIACSLDLFPLVISLDVWLSCSKNKIEEKIGEKNFKKILDFF